MKRLIQWFYLFICSSKPWAIEKSLNPIIFILCHLYFILMVGIIFPGPHTARRLHENNLVPFSRQTLFIGFFFLFCIMHSHITINVWENFVDNYLNKSISIIKLFDNRCWQPLLDILIHQLIPSFAAIRTNYKPWIIF